MQTLRISTTSPITIPATQFVRQCREVLDSLQRGGEVIITRHQQQIARLLPIAGHLDSRLGQTSRPKTYSFFNAIKPIDVAELPADYSLNFEQSLYPDLHAGRAA